MKTRPLELFPLLILLTGIPPLPLVSAQEPVAQSAQSSGQAPKPVPSALPPFIVQPPQKTSAPEASQKRLPMILVVIVAMLLISAWQWFKAGRRQK